MDGFTEAQKKKLMSIPLMKEVKKLYDEQMKGSGRRGRMRGRGFFDDAWAWIKGAATDVDAWLKRTKALSTVGKVVTALGAIPGLQEFLPVGAAVTGAATAMGYGKMRGGDSRLVIQPKSSRIRGMGYAPQGHTNMVFSSTGVIAPTSNRIKGGAGTVYGAVYSEYSKPKF